MTVSQGSTTELTRLQKAVVLFPTTARVSAELSEDCWIARGNTAATYTYDPYPSVAAKTGTSTTAFQYAGQYTDAESGLQYLRNRYYDPATEQFLTVDPIIGATGEPYSYTAGGPLNAADPFGLGCGFVPGVPCPGDVLHAAGHAAGGFIRQHPVATAVVVVGVIVVAGVVCVVATDGACTEALPGAIGAAGDVVLPVARWLSGAAPRYPGIPEDITPPGYDPNTWRLYPDTYLNKPPCWRFFDPDMREWRYAPDDPRHYEHWDFRENDHLSSPWQNISIRPDGEIYKPGVPRPEK